MVDLTRPDERRDRPRPDGISEADCGMVQGGTAMLALTDDEHLRSFVDDGPRKRDRDEPCAADPGRGTSGRRGR